MPDVELGKKQPGFWSSIPGVLTGLAALVAAIGGLVLALRPVPPKAPIAVEAPSVSVTSPPSHKARMSVLEYNTNRGGSDLTKLVVADIDDCLNRCIAKEECKAISFLEAEKTCWLKGEVPPRGELQGFTSAVKIDK